MVRIWALAKQSVYMAIKLQRSQVALFLADTCLTRARILAIVRNQDCRLRVTSNVTYLIECQTPEWVTIAFHQLASAFTITANNRPEFHPLGNVGPMATISIRNERGANRRIIVSRSGRVRTE